MACHRGINEMVKLLVLALVAAAAVLALASLQPAGPRKRERAQPRQTVPEAAKEVNRMSMSMTMKTAMLGLVALAMGAVLLIGASSALYTESVSVGSNTFDAATYDLSTSPSSAIWTAVTAGVPGDRATGSITVSNDGEADLRYAITGANTDATLSAAMNLRIATKAGGACDFPYHNADGTTTALTDDTEIYAGAMDTAALVGSTAQGAQAGDRTLAASAAEDLCFAVVLPLSAGSAVQGLNNTATFTFASEQTANNP